MSKARFAHLLALALLFQLSASLNAGLVLSKSSYTDYQAAVIGKASKLVEEQKLVEARKLLGDLRSERKDLLEPEIVLFEMLVNQGQLPKAKKLLDGYSAVASPGFGIFYAYAKLAELEARWFDAFMHANLALNNPMPEDWSDDYRKQMILEAQIVILRSGIAREAWSQAQEVLDNFELNKDTESRVLELSARLAFEQDKIDEARERFSWLRQQDEGRPPAELELARLQSANKQSEQADKNYQAAIRSLSGKQQTLAVIEYSNHLLTVGRATDASRLLKRAAENTSDSDQTRALEFGQAKALRMSGKFENAITKLESLLHQDQESFAIRNQLALCLAHLNARQSTDYGLRLAKMNIEKNPQQLEGWSTLGFLQVLSGQLDEAKDSLTRATANGVISRDTAYFIHRLHVASGDKTSADKFLQAAKDGDGPFYFESQLN